MSGMTPLNIVIPMAGEGSRFRTAGYAKPKPFIDIQGKPMIRWVLENLRVPNSHFILLSRPEHLEAEYQIVRSIERDFSVSIVTVDSLTEGSVCTILFARSLIDSDAPLLIANSDQWIESDVNDMLAEAGRRQWDGAILTFVDPEKNVKWSFARTNADKEVLEVREKVPISEHATVGIYYFRQGRVFVDAALDMIVHNDRVNNEFYTCPVYNWAIKNGCRIGAHDIPFSAMHGLGTPADLDRFASFLEGRSSVSSPPQ